MMRVKRRFFRNGPFKAIFILENFIGKKHLGILRADN
jgi:hypothetical protein